MIGPFDGLPWFEFQNQNAAQVPAFGLMRVTGITVVEAGRVVITCDQPNAYGSQYAHMVNGDTPVSQNDYGVCTRFGLFPALYDNADGTPGFGDLWGPRNGTWKLKKNTGGFFVYGVPNSSAFLALVQAAPMLSARGTIASDIAAGASGTLTVFTGAYGSETTTSQTISNVLNGSSCTLKSNSATNIHRAVWDWDNGGQWQFDVGKTT